MPTRWGPPATRCPANFSSEQFSPGGRAVSLGGKRTTPKSYCDLKIMGWDARKSHSTRRVLECSLGASLLIRGDLLSHRRGPRELNVPRWAQRARVTPGYRWLSPQGLFAQIHWLVSKDTHGGKSAMNSFVVKRINVLLFHTTLPG